MDFQTEKKVVLSFYTALENAGQSESTSVFENYCSANWLWRGVHPFDVQTGPVAVNTNFWSGFSHAFSSLQRRMDVFMAGENSLSDAKEIWVTSMGHFMGLFDNPWLGIKPTQKLVMLRYAEFHRVEAGKIVETALFLDIPALMMQVGLRPFPDQTAAQFVQPGPLPHNAIMTEAQPAQEGAKTLTAINQMISDLGQWKLGLPLEEELARSWHSDMVWWGPAGIGATYTIERYAKQHSGPFRAGFTDRSATGHICRFAEGHYGGFFGWPNFTAKPTGGFLGMPASDKAGEFRVVDIYRRRDDKLIENWVFIDLLHFLKTQGLDVLQRLQTWQV
jgi:predicted ester cyclase